MRVRYLSFGVSPSASRLLLTLSARYLVSGMEARFFLLFWFAILSQAQLRSCYDVGGTLSLDFPCNPSTNVSTITLQRLDSLESSDCL